MYKKAPRLDATNIAGITTLMNPQHVKNNVNLQQIENDIMQKEKDVVQDNDIDDDPIKHYTDEINKLAEELGVDLVHSLDEKANTLSSLTNTYEKKIVTIDDVNLDINSDAGTSVSSSSSKISKTSKSSRSSKSSVNVDKLISTLDEDVGIDISSEKYKSRYNMPKMDYQQLDNNADKKTLHHIINDMHHETKTVQGVEREKVQDIKLSKIEQISQLRMTLEEEGINCNNIKQPNLDTPLDEIDSILNILRLKNDRNRYSTIAEELILGMAEGIETVFDGTRKVPILNWSPDYRGYHSTVNIKLHRMRFETSQVVGSVIEKYNISPSMRILMELLPSFFLYPRQQSKQKNTPGLHSDPKIGDARLAYASIKEMEDKKRNEELENI
jgi:hypothetical protein